MDSTAPTLKLKEVLIPFLAKAVDGGFTGVTPAPDERNSFKLLQNVDDLLERELSVHGAPKRIETALPASVNHDATVAWLDEFRWALSGQA